MNRRILAVAVVLALAGAACGINLQPPITRIETGPAQTADIQLPLPEDAAAGAEVTLAFAAGELTLAPGAEGYLVSGTAVYNATEFEPKIESSGASHTVRSGEMALEGLPVVEGNLQNEWDLLLADTPLRLTVKAGAYKGSFELGGLALERLEISDGGADVTGAFSRPNQAEMAVFTYTTGASNGKLSGLANANFARMDFKSGAGDYTLSFDGDLQRDAEVNIDAGLATVTVVVPEGMNARLTLDAGLSTVNLGGPWAQSGSEYTVAGSGPTLTITVEMGAGTLNLR